MKLKVPCEPGGRCLHDTTVPENVYALLEAELISKIKTSLGDDNEMWDERMEYASSHSLAIKAEEYLVPTLLGLWFERLEYN